MSIIKLRILLHASRKQPLAALKHVAVLAFLLGSAALIVSATVYNVRANDGFKDPVANIVVGSIIFFLVLIAILGQYFAIREDIEEVLTPHAHQEGYVKSYDYFMETLPKSVPVKLF